MRTLALVLIAWSWASFAVLARDRADLQRLVNTPDTYVGKRIVVPGINCVDDPKGGYACVKSVGGQRLRIQAAALGERTSTKIAERLLGDCKGTANLKRAACRVDAEIEPAGATREITETPRGSVPVTVVNAGSIDMYEVTSIGRARKSKAPSVSPRSKSP